MYCRFCGQEIKDDAVVCPHCGCATGNKCLSSNPNDAPSAGWGFLGFLLPILGLILYLVWRSDYPLRAKSVGRGALIAVVLEVVFAIVLVIIFVGAASCIAVGY